MKRRFHGHRPPASPPRLWESRLSALRHAVSAADERFQRLARSPIFRTAKAPSSPPSCRKAVRHERPPRSDRIDNRWWHRRSDRSTAERSEEQTSELQSLMRTSYAVFCLQKKK